MKITDVTAEVLSYPVKEPFWNGRGALSPAEGGRVHRARAMVLVWIQTDEGITGIGEAGLAGAPAAVVAAAVEHHLRPLLVGENPFHVERLWRKGYESAGGSGRRGVMMHALSGVDIALWDLLGKALNAPIHRLLGTYRERVPAYASAGFYAEGKGPEELAAELKEHKAAGFRAGKMKVGALPFDEDIARVEAVREAVEDDFALMVDANSSYSVKAAIRMGEALEDLAIEWFEEPVRADNLDGSAAVAAALEIPVAGYETEYGLYGFRELITRRAVDVVQPDIAWSGGFSECGRIAALVAAHDLTCSPHCFSSALTMVASLHLLASLPNGWLEFDRTPNAMRDELLLEPLQIEADGSVAVPEGPGLGVTLNEDTVAKYRVGEKPKRAPARRRSGSKSA